MITQKIKKIASSRNETFASIERVLGLGQGTIRKWDSNSPSVDKLQKVANLLNVSIDWLVGNEGTSFQGIQLSKEESNLVDDFNKLDEIEKTIILEKIQTLLEIRLKRAEKEAAEKVAREKEAAAKPNLSVVPDPEEDDEEREMIQMIVADEKASAGLGSYHDAYAQFEKEWFYEDEVPRGASFGVRIRGDSMEPKISDGDIVWVRPQPTVDNGQIGIFLYDGFTYCKKLRYNDKRTKVWLESINEEYDPIEINRDAEFRTIGLVVF